MNQLRQLIRRIILEGPVKDAFDEKWYNTEVERYDWSRVGSEAGTFHKDAFGIKMPVDTLKDKYGFDYHQLFTDKRDLKRLWNETIDANGLRSFWEGPKMKYFHSLSYYGSSHSAVETLQQGEYSDNDIRDLSIAAFLRDYKLTGNKDEMSTYGVYMPDKSTHLLDMNPHQMTIGVLLQGRVTIATVDDAWTESRSKASKTDIKKHKSSGMPKRIMPTNANVHSLLFEEEDIKDKAIGECVLDNWGIEAIVYNPKKREGILLQDVVRKLSKQYGIPVVTAQEVFGA